jgi:hypothetical protein
MPKKTAHNKKILYGMAKGPWADFWAREREEMGESFSGRNIYDICPEPPKEARKWAREIADEIVKRNRKSLSDLYQLARADGFSDDEEDFGFHLGCQACGMGLRWDDDLTPNNTLEIEVPQREFYI